ncbi:YhcG family protein [Agrococcus sp. Ld7]|uniref:PDDEXK nuclease domain-containing protein n=1 Tax=Agrococcus sp. Ld7 TaxID=649148 RepID=UPI003868F9CC
MTEIELPDRYGEVLAELKQRVHRAHLRAQRAVNTELIGLYWHIGHTILEQQRMAGWGGKVVQQLAHDLRREFPEMTGLSRSNLLYMRSFAEAWPDGFSIVPQPVGHLPSGHIRLLIDKLTGRDDRDWYAERSVNEGWSRAVLEHNIMGQLRQRTGAAQSSFNGQLEERDARLAQAISRDPYVFDFLGLAAGAAERDLEQAMIDQIVDVLRELGPGWAFVDRQKHVEIDGDDFTIDLLFFHTEQLRYVVFELKAGKFKPEYTGQLGFYVAVVDDLIRGPQHAPSIGILLCSGKNESVVRYALGASAGPLAVSSYTYETLPPAEQQALPDAETISRALDGLGSAQPRHDDESEQ